VLQSITAALTAQPGALRASPNLFLQRDMPKKSQGTRDLPLSLSCDLGSGDQDKTGQTVVFCAAEELTSGVGCKQASNPRYHSWQSGIGDSRRGLG